MPTVDWDAIYEEADFNPEPPADGDHLAVIEAAEWKVTAKKDPMMVVRFRITQPGPDRNKKAWNRNVIIKGNSSSLAINMRQIEAYGLNKQLLKSLSEDEQCERITGNEVVITTETKPRDDRPNEMQTNITRVVAAPSQGAKSAPKTGGLPVSKVEPTPTSTPPPAAPFGGQ